jgi:hypothetical protein
MCRPSIVAALALCLLAPSLSTAQTEAPAEPIVRWSFDAEVGGWQSADPAAQPTIATDANVIRADETGGVLEYEYTPGAFSGIVAPVETGLDGARSLHYWLSTTDYALLANVLTEIDGSEYVAMVCSLPGAWQEVALDLGEFELGEDSSDENEQLDADQVQTIAIADITGFLAEAALNETFLVAPDLEPRIMWLDEFAASTESLGPRWQEFEVDGKPAVRLDSFEQSPLRWFLLAGKGIDVDYDQDHVADGEFSLRIAYDLPPGKLVGAMTGMNGAPLTGMQRLSLSLMSEVPTTLIVQLKERDGSEYRTIRGITATDALQRLHFGLEELELGDDSQDENGRLDLDQVKEFVLADGSLMTETPVRVNTLWIDDIVFSQ